MNLLSEQIQAIAREAGEIILRAGISSENAITGETVSAKPGHANYVTFYDGQVQSFLFDRLSKILPQAAFYGEEDGKNVFLDSYRTGDTFVIDPIDGTSNFMKGYRPSVISIGLLRDGEPWLGVVYAPFSDQMFSAVRGEGAYENGIPIHSSEDPLETSLVLMGTAPYREDLSGKAFALGARYISRCIDIRRSGSAAWDFCMVASGRIGFYFEPQACLYDFAAGACIAMEAGAAVTDLYGNPISFTGDSSLAAASAGVSGSDYLPAQLWGIDWMSL